MHSSISRCDFQKAKIMTLTQIWGEHRSKIYQFTTEETIEVMSLVLRAFEIMGIYRVLLLFVSLKKVDIRLLDRYKTG